MNHKKLQSHGFLVHVKEIDCNNMDDYYEDDNDSFDDVIVFWLRAFKWCTKQKWLW